MNSPFRIEGVSYILHLEVTELPSQNPFMRSFPLVVAVFCSIILLSRSVRRVIVVGGGAAGYFSAIQCATVLQEKCINAEV